MLQNLKDAPLSNFFNRITFRKGRVSAISATARKLAVIIGNMVIKKQPYNPPTQYLFFRSEKKNVVNKKMKKQINKFDITGQDLGIVTT